MKRIAILCFALLVTINSSMAASPDAGEYLNGAMRVFARITEDKTSGESFCWHAAFSIKEFVMGYKAYGDRAWLDAGVKYYDKLMDIRATAGDGYKGFIGPAIYDKKVFSESHISDAIIYDALLEFAEVVRSDSELNAIYGEKASYYVAEAEKQMIEKWDARDTWRQDGDFGCYVNWPKWSKAGDFKNFTDNPPVRKGGLSLPFNKNNELGVCCLRLYRLTGKQEYLDKATAIFAWARSRMQPVDGRLQWNYWEPFGPWDIRPDGRGFTHWVNTHPYRNYQAGEVGQIVEAYHAGVVFSDDDIKAIIKTNLEVMWNGSFDKPDYENSNIKIPGYTEPKASKAYPTWAGTLWSSLAGFDPTIRRLRSIQCENIKGVMDQIHCDYFKNVTCSQPPQFKRRHLDSSGQLHIPEAISAVGGDSAELMFAAAIPATSKAGSEMMLCCTAFVGGEVSFSVRPADGNAEAADSSADLKVLHRHRIGQPLIYRWDMKYADSKNLEPGDYIIRWSFREGFREQLIHIK